MREGEPAEKIERERKKELVMRRPTIICSYTNSNNNKS